MKKPVRLVKAKVHPWNIEEVHKGWSISPAELEELTGARQHTSKFQFGVMALTAQLRRELMADGRPACVRVVDHCLRVLTDAEAVSKTKEDSDKAVRKIITAECEMSVIDVAQLDDADIGKLDRNRMISASRCAALRGARAATVRRIKGKNSS